MTPVDAIEQLRTANRYTDAEIGRMVDTSQSTIAKIRNGKRNPSYSLGTALGSLAKRKSK
jgi:transcriptional regulator with XRE-family HTH domain